MTFPYYKDADAIMIIFNRNFRESYDNLDKWVENIKKYAKNDVILIVVGNKYDLEAQASTDEVQEKALKYKLIYIEVSAKNDEQIENLFEIVTRSLVDLKKSKLREKYL